jgi:ankyrin repeat protein
MYDFFQNEDDFIKENNDCINDLYLLLSISQNDIEAVNYLLNKGANPNRFNTKSLLKAVIKNNLEIVKILIRYGANITIKSPAYKKALENGNVKILEYFNNILLRSDVNNER